MPVGLLEAAVGGSPIEYWLSAESIAKCETDQPQCDDQMPDSSFYDDQIVSLQPYSLGAIIWDQAERDLKCNHVTEYPCLMRELARSWRLAFASPGAPLIAVQLPDYYDAKDPGAPGVPGFASTSEGVFEMRLAQEAGIAGDSNTALVATYDQSCNNLAFSENCPFGSVHNVHKQELGNRIAMQLARLMQGEDLVTEGPRAKLASAKALTKGGFSISITFAGGTTPFALQPTRNCTECCDGSLGAAASGDFEASHDGKLWSAGKNARMQGDDVVVFHAEMATKPAFVRYTAGSNFTQCALFNKESLPAMPFKLPVTDQQLKEDFVVV